MDSLSAPIRRGPIPWQGLLFAVSLLNFWSLLTTAEFVVLSENAVKGSDVMLQTRNVPPDVRYFIWFRGKGINYKRLIVILGTFRGRRGTGPEYSGREEINSDGSLVINKVTEEDTGAYTLVVYPAYIKKEIRVAWLNVYEPVRVPTLQASKTTVMEHKDSVVLTCCTNAESTRWIFNGMNLQLTERMKLSSNDTYLIIDPVSREDAGNYQCEVYNPISSAESEPVKLDVKY